MQKTVTIDRAGRIVLPVEIRRRLNLGPGTRLMLGVVAQRIELTPAPEADAELVTAGSRRAVPRPSGKPCDAAAATRAEREAQARRSR
jgi:AbrB family looped-hinge helix DNA binding protein